jgi:hypothetical protein
VAESYGDGMAAALDHYIKSLPERCHVVLAYRRPGSQVGSELTGRAR